MDRGKSLLKRRLGFSPKNALARSRTFHKTKRVPEKLKNFTPPLLRELFVSKIAFTPVNHLIRSSVISTLGFARSLFKIDA